MTSFPIDTPVSVVEKQSLEAIKTAAITEGVRVSAAAVAILTSVSESLSIHECLTAGGITLEREADVFVNVPFDAWCCETASTTLNAEDGDLVLQRGDAFARVITIGGSFRFRGRDRTMVLPERSNGNERSCRLLQVRNTFETRAPHCQLSTTAAALSNDLDLLP